MKFFELSFSTTILRFYFMMAIVIAAGFLHFWPLAFLALPVFMSCLMGVSFQRSTQTTAVAERFPGKISQMPDHGKIAA